MADIVLTAQQQAAAEDRGGALLVSAAAGSGKTAVLVERLMGYLTDPDDPADLDEFLIITYTRAAATELRGKIARRLSAQIAAHPEDAALQRQLTRLYQAQISTVHAFCQTILRQYAAEAELPADFRVADEQQAAILGAQTLRETIAELYDDIAQEPDFAAMVDTLGYGRDDNRLAELAAQCYTVMRCRVDPEGWMRQCLQAYAQPLDQTPWYAYFMELRARTLENAAALLEQAAQLCLRDAALEEKYRPILLGDLALIQDMRQARTWDDCVQAPQFVRLAVVRKCGDTDAQARVRALRDRAKSMVKDIQGCFYAPQIQVEQDLGRTLPALRGLLRLLRLYDRRYSEEKRRRKLLDFSDLEHEAVRLLTVRRTGEPSACARAIGAGYREILIDEYQDSNALQECIFRALSRDGKNLFMVGDVKQSIYRFRLADPDIFLRKYESYPLRGSEVPGAPRKLLLSQNFRSRPEILAAVNDVFSLVMQKSDVELTYSPADALTAGNPAAFAAAEGAKVELHCLDLQTDPEDESSGGKTEAEAAFVADRIAQMLQDGTEISDGGTLRPVRPSDIVILMRSANMTAAAYQSALLARGILCDAGAGGDLLQTAEVEILVQLMQIIDNPHRDIPLLGAMMSPVFAFAPEELAQLRAAAKDADIYTCLLRCQEPSERLRRFLTWLADMRARSRYTALPELLPQIIRTSELDTVFAARPDGQKRMENLQAFAAFAAQRAQADGCGLSGLVQTLQLMQQRGDTFPAPQPTVRDDAVRIMSIHKSKGLEFPVVILADLSRMMNLQDSSAAVLSDEQLLLGGNVVDLASRSYFPSLARMAIMRRKRAQSVAEELRVLYVAMTRAKDRLIMTSCAAHFDKRLEALGQLMARPLPPGLSASVTHPDEWVLMAALCRTEAGALFACCGQSPCSTVCEKENCWKITMRQVTGTPERERGRKPASAIVCAPYDREQAEQVMRFHYPHEAATRVPSKLTATQLKGRGLDDEAAEQTAPAAPKALRTPQFLRDRPLTGREKGIATHLFMQFARYEACTDADGVREELRRLQREKFLTDKQTEAVRADKILTLFASGLGRRILAAQALRREFKFSILTDAGEYCPQAQGEQIMLQGVVDCFWQEPEGLVIVDFKTDFINGDLEEKAARYRPQLRAYAQALGRIFEQPVKQTLLYFFSADAAVEV